MKPLHIFLLVLIAIAAIVGVNATYSVKETDQAMVLAFGKVERLEAEPGLHFKVPFYHQVIYFDKRILETDSQPEEMQAGDKKRIKVDSFTRWRIVDAKKFYETVRTEASARNRLNVIVNSNIRQAVAEKPLNSLVTTERAAIMDKILQATRQEAQALGIEIVDVRIKRTDLPEKNERAVFERMRAEREKEAKEIRAEGAEEAQKIRAEADKKKTVMLAEAQRDAETLRGEGDAEAIRIFAEAFNRDPSFYQFTRSLDAYRNSLKSQETLMVLDPSLEFFKHFDSVSGK